MTTQLVRVNPSDVPIALSVFGEERLALLKEQLGRGWPEPMTDAELEHIGLVCQRTRLDPLVKPPQIYFIKRKDTKLQKYVMTPQVSIDGLRLIAKRSRNYLGQTPYMWCGRDGVWREFWDEDEPPTAAKVGVLARGFRDYLYAVATWREWAQHEQVWEGPAGNRRQTGTKLAQFWETKGAHMLAKTAEAIALKRAFPEETNELELAALDQEWRDQAAATARRYDEIFGRDEDATAFADLPQQHALNAAGQPVDAQTGELLEDSAADGPPASAVPQGRGDSAQPAGSPRRPHKDEEAMF